MRIPADSHSLTSPLLPGLAAWIKVGGKPPKVYGVRKEGKKTLAYVEGRAGDAFEVVYSDQRSSTPTAYMTALYMNGEEAESLLTSVNDECYDTPLQDDSRCAVAQGTSLRPFRFGPAPKSHKSNHAQGSVSGYAQLWYWRVKGIKKSGKEWSSAARKAEDEDEEMRTPRMKGANFSYVDGQASPIMFLEFQFRDADFLRKKGFLTEPVPRPSAEAIKAKKVVPSPSAKPSRTGLPRASASLTAPLPANALYPPAPLEQPLASASQAPHTASRARPSIGQQSQRSHRSHSTVSAVSAPSPSLGSCGAVPSSPLSAASPPYTAAAAPAPPSASPIPPPNPSASTSQPEAGSFPRASPSYTRNAPASATPANLTSPSTKLKMAPSSPSSAEKAAAARSKELRKKKKELERLKLELRIAELEAEIAEVEEQEEEETRVKREQDAKDERARKRVKVEGGA
ncbi:hypothetical protein JCM10213_002388 [Rhodosporidiobolus nylandii]